MICYMHSVPGRVRIRSKILRSNSGLRGAIVGACESLPGVCSVKANGLTGSVLVTYDQQAAGEQDILAVIRKSGYLPPAKSLLDRQLSAACERAGERIAKALVKMALERALSKAGLSLLAAVL